MDHLF